MLEFLIILIVLALLAGAGWYFWSQYQTGNGASGGGMFGGGKEKRLGVVEQASVDGRRKLVLIRRDGVEHLIMTGGPVDVLVETGISPQRRQAGYAPQPQHQHPQQLGEPLDPGQPQATFGRLRQRGAPSSVE